MEHSSVPSSGVYAPDFSCCIADRAKSDALIMKQGQAQGQEQSQKLKQGRDVVRFSSRRLGFHRRVSAMIFIFTIDRVCASYGVGGSTAWTGASALAAVMPVLSIIKSTVLKPFLVGSDVKSGRPRTMHEPAVDGRFLRDLYDDERRQDHMIVSELRDRLVFEAVGALDALGASCPRSSLVIRDGFQSHQITQPSSDIADHLRSALATTGWPDDETPSS